MSYLREGLGTRRTPPTEPIPGSTQVPNNAGGFVWKVGSLARLRRFLILGSEGGSYYVRQRELTVENVESLRVAFDEHGPVAVDEIVDVSIGGLAPKVDPAIFALAMASGHARLDVRQAALGALPLVCRTGTHLLHFAAFVEQWRGHGRALNRALGDWYCEKAPDSLAYQLVKYRARDAWSHRDVLRLARPKPCVDVEEADGELVERDSPEHDALFRWVVKGGEVEGPRPDRYRVEAVSQLPEIIEGYERAKRSSSPRETAALIREYRLTHEMISDDHKTSPEVWEALLEGMPFTALIRELGRMTRVGLIAPMSDGTQEVLRRLSDRAGLHNARVHPMTILIAQTVYEAGHAVRGHTSWTPVTQVIDALDGAFYDAFQNVEPTGKRHLLALDVSGSMDWATNQVMGISGLTSRVCAAAMALVTEAAEPMNHIVAFTAGPMGHGCLPVAISSRQRVPDVCRTVAQIPPGGTDVSLPMRYAMDFGFEVDAFVIYTDSENWAGEWASGHPAQALVDYRQMMGIDARMIVVGMASNGFSVADPADPLSLDVVGFDASAPAVIANFVAGAL